MIRVKVRFCYWMVLSRKVKQRKTYKGPLELSNYEDSEPEIGINLQKNEILSVDTFKFGRGFHHMRWDILFHYLEAAYRSFVNQKVTKWTKFYLILNLKRFATLT